ncbi:MAG: hypothetical protein WC246_00815 [Candidatus Paceibacterota bacterium]
MAIKRVLWTLIGEAGIAFVESVGEADLVIFTDPRDIERGYDNEKSYAFLHAGGDVPALPEKCAVVSATEAIAGFMKIIDGISKEPLPLSQEIGASSVLANPKRILVIDDTPQHIRSAKKGLAGHQLTTVMGYDDAMEALATETFDVVLSDLHLPMSSKMLGDTFRFGGLVPYGILLMIEAARRGATHVAVVTDLSHHDDPFSAAFDHFSRFSVQIEGAKVMMLHARVTEEGKDWVASMQSLVGE